MIELRRIKLLEEESESTTTAMTYFCFQGCSLNFQGNFRVFPGVKVSKISGKNMQFVGRRSPVYARHGMVSSSQPLVS